MPRRTLRSLVLTMTVLGLATLLPTGAGAADEPDVVVKDFVFGPAAVEVVAGEKVVWFVEQGTHTITADLDDDGEREFDSGVLDAPDTFDDWTPRKSRTYEYFCTIHPDVMRGTITVVQERTTTTSTPTTTSTTAPPATSPTTAPPATTSTTSPPAPTATTAPPPPSSSAQAPAPDPDFDYDYDYDADLDAAPSGSPAPAAPVATGGGTKKKPRGSSTTTSAPKPDKGGADPAPATDDTAPPAPEAPPQIVEAAITDVTAPTPSPGAGDQAGELASAPAADERPARSASKLLLGVAALVALALLGGGGFAWYHRSSRYLPA